MENHNIVIIGMPGSGKTTFGTALAEALGRDFYDADTYLETSEGRTIKELFAVKIGRASCRERVLRLV